MSPCRPPVTKCNGCGQGRDELVEVRQLAKCDGIECGRRKPYDDDIHHLDAERASKAPPATPETSDNLKMVDCFADAVRNRAMPGNTRNIFFGEKRCLRCGVIGSGQFFLDKSKRSHDMKSIRNLRDVSADILARQR